MQSRRLFWLLLALFLTSCTLSVVPTPTATRDITVSNTLTVSLTHTAAPTFTFTPIPTATRRPTRIPTVTNTPEPTLAPTTTFAPLTMRLPHDLYFLSPGSTKKDSGTRPKQIWRLASNGVTLTEITHEDYDVAEFDVSHVTGRLVYVTDQLHRNQLILIRPDGSGRQVIVDTGPDDGWGLNWVNSPRWSPDGQILAYHHGGVMFYHVQASQVVNVFADHVDEKGSAYNLSYSPELWSPDGKRLLIIEGGFEGGWWSVYNLEEKTLVRMNGPYAGGTATWSADSRLAVFTSSYEMGDGCVDLLQFDVLAKVGTVTIPCQFSKDGYSNSGWPWLTLAGDLLYFHNSADSNAIYFTGPQPPWTIMRSKWDEAVAPVLLRSGIPEDISEVLWADDGMIAIISVRDGPLALMPTDGSHPLQLLVPEGSNLRWRP